MGTEPGTIKRFTPDDVRTVKKLSHLSLHEVDIINVIELAGQLGESPEEIVFFGIEPETIDQRMELSGKIEKEIGNYIRLIKSRL